MATEQPLLSCRSLVVGYSGVALLPPIEMTIRSGEYWAVIGRNGSGKSTWLRTLLRLLPPVAGEVRNEKPNLRVSYLAQRQAYDDSYPLLARDVVAMGLDRRHSFLWPRGSKNRDQVGRALKLVGAADVAVRPFRQLSEGQKQRVLFARVAVGEPDLAVLDEPTSAMDKIAEREACDVLRKLAQETGCALVVVSHYIGLVAEYANRAVLLDRDTPAVLVGLPNEIFAADVFRHRYGDVVPEGPRP